MEGKIRNVDGQNIQSTAANKWKIYYECSWDCIGCILMI